MLNAKDRKRFWNRVDIRGIDDCWPWMGARRPKGYGNFRLGGEVLNTSRVVYREFYGDGLYAPDPTSPSQSLTVMHGCDHPWCCNPSHLRLGTNAENMADRLNKGRYRKKLTEKEVLEIRAKYATGEYTYQQLADEYGVSQTTIGEIVNYKIWRHLP